MRRPVAFSVEGFRAVNDNIFDKALGPAAMGKVGDEGERTGAENMTFYFGHQDVAGGVTEDLLPAGLHIFALEGIAINVSEGFFERS